VAPWHTKRPGERWGRCRAGREDCTIGGLRSRRRTVSASVAIRKAGLWKDRGAKWLATPPDDTIVGFEWPNWTPMSHLAEIALDRRLLWNAFRIKSSGGLNPLQIDSLPKATRRASSIRSAPLIFEGPAASRSFPTGCCGLQSGLYPEPQAFATRWALYRRFSAVMNADTRARKIAAWRDAVLRTLSGSAQFFPLYSQLIELHRVSLRDLGAPQPS
jgi:hypothetical protein